jgi:hypothetical protein
MNSLQLGQEILNFRESWPDGGFLAQIVKEFLIRPAPLYSFILCIDAIMHILSILYLDHSLRIFLTGLEKDLKGRSTKFNDELGPFITSSI